MYNDREDRAGKSPNLTPRQRAEMNQKKYSHGNGFNIRRAIESIRSIWANLAQKNHSTILVIIDTSVPEFLAINPHKALHCLNNLVENAVRNTRGGTVSIIASAIAPLADTQDSYGHFALSIRDTGSGMSEEKFATIFREPNTAPEQSQQTGQSHQTGQAQQTGQPQQYGVIDTGLPMAHRLTRELGGNLVAKSELGKGSVFSLLFPLDSPIVHIDDPKRHPSEKSSKVTTPQNGLQLHPSLRNVNILVVDDYNLNQLTIKSMLHSHEGKIFTANNGFEALDVLYSCSVDIIFMDIHMPVMDGIEATLKIRESNEHWANVRIIAMTADPQYHHLSLCQKIGMDDTLAKPFRKPDVFKVLNAFAVPFKNMVIP